MEKIFAVISVARQINGEYVFVMTDKAFAKASQADTLLAQKKAEYATADGKPKSVMITTPLGQAECVCEVGVFALDYEHGE